AKARLNFGEYAALKRRSSTVLRAFGILCNARSVLILQEIKLSQKSSRQGWRRKAGSSSSHGHSLRELSCEFSE
ncbi:MAG: hypothetical protein WBX10_20480, partial [Candidatus Sulfotelmatobacter sp.]